MSQLNVDAIRASNGTGDAISFTASSNTCTANITNFPNRNKIINGNFDVWQRKTTSTFGAGVEYVADRWVCGGAASTTVSRQAFTLGQTDVPNEPKYHLQSAWTANSQNYEIAQKIEGVRTLAGQKATVSFWIKRSTGSITLAARLVQYFGTGGSPSATVITSLGTPTLTTSWQKLTYTVDVPSISGKTIGSNNDDSLWFSLQVTDTNTGTVQLSQVQVEKGSVATDFEHRSYGDELRRCYRYYFRQTLANNDFFGMGFAADSSFGDVAVQFPVSMRAKPTGLEQTGTAGDYKLARRTSSTTCSAVPTFANSTENFGNLTWTTGSGMNGGEAVFLQSTGDDHYIGWTGAEL